MLPPYAAYLLLLDAYHALTCPSAVREALRHCLASLKAQGYAEWTRVAACECHALEAESLDPRHTGARRTAAGVCLPSGSIMPSISTLVALFFAAWIIGTIVVMVVRYRRDLRHYRARKGEMQERERRVLECMDALQALWQDDALGSDELRARAEAVILALAQCCQGQDSGVIADARRDLAAALARRGNAWSRSEVRQRGQVHSRLRVKQPDPFALFRATLKRGGVSYRRPSAQGQHHRHVGDG